MSTKTGVIAWVYREEYSTVETSSKAPCWVLLRLIHIPNYLVDCQLVMENKRIVVGNAICIACSEIIATKITKENKLMASGTTPLNHHVERCFKTQGSKLNDARLYFQKLDVNISKEDRILIKESQSALVSGGILPLSFCDREVFQKFSQVMLQIGSKNKNPEASKVLFGKTAVRENILLKLERCKSLLNIK